LITAFICFYLSGFELGSAKAITGLFVLQYATAAIAARHKRGSPCHERAVHTFNDPDSAPNSVPA
jgi:hypothetical protein